MNFGEKEFEIISRLGTFIQMKESQDDPIPENLRGRCNPFQTRKKKEANLILITVTTFRLWDGNGGVGSRRHPGAIRGVRVGTERHAAHSI